MEAFPQIREVTDEQNLFHRIAFYIIFLFSQGTEIILDLNHWSIWPSQEWSVLSIMCMNSAHVILSRCRESLVVKLRPS